MCYYQNIHTTPHYALLNVDGEERESHFCRLSRPRRTGRDADGHGVGLLCRDHRCCRVRREVVRRCELAKSGGEEEVVCGENDDDSTTTTTFGEDVFVPPENMGEEKGKVGEGEGEGEGVEEREEQGKKQRRGLYWLGYLVEVVCFLYGGSPARDGRSEPASKTDKERRRDRRKARRAYLKALAAKRYQDRIDREVHH
ncbi:hypothetical protein F5X99DRAFT_429995 [Biscogniauxia marginata]|nr:hypothetical protein F5X99DRAFT_429995 [Biscogniauxia marginata]